MAGVLGNPAGTFINNFVSDCNEISANGYYPFVTKPLNAPEDISTGSVLAFVASSMKVQYFFTDVEARVYSRRKWYGNDWSPWQRIDNFGYNSLDELATGVAGKMGKGNIGVDFNTIKESGCWSIVDDGLNIPNNVTSYGVLWSLYSEGSYPWTQIVLSRLGNVKKYRTCSDSGGWSEWFDL